MQVHWIFVAKMTMMVMWMCMRRVVVNVRILECHEQSFQVHMCCHYRCVRWITKMHVSRQWMRCWMGWRWSSCTPGRTTSLMPYLGSVILNWRSWGHLPSSVQLHHSHGPVLPFWWVGAHAYLGALFLNWLMPWNDFHLSNHTSATALFNSWCLVCMCTHTVSTWHV